MQSQVSYLCKERNYAPWVQASEALYSYVLRVIKPRTGEKDFKEREKVWEKFRIWVTSLVMPYFKETGGFTFSGKLTEEEKHLKLHMIEFACGKLDLTPCMDSAKKQWAEKSADKKQIDSYLLKTIKRFGTNVWNPLPHANIKAFCDKMLKGAPNDFDADEGLLYLKKCWDRLNKLPKREILLSKLVSKVELHEDVEKLKKWWKSIGGGKQPGGNVNPRALKEHTWATKILKNVNRRAQSKEDCRPMLYETIKQVFK